MGAIFCYALLLKNVYFLLATTFCFYDLPRPLLPDLDLVRLLVVPLLGLLDLDADLEWERPPRPPRFSSTRRSLLPDSSVSSILSRAYCIPLRSANSTNLEKMTELFFIIPFCVPAISITSN